MSISSTVLLEVVQFFAGREPFSALRIQAFPPSPDVVLERPRIHYPRSAATSGTEGWSHFLGRLHSNLHALEIAVMLLCHHAHDLGIVGPHDASERVEHSADELIDIR